MDFETIEQAREHILNLDCQIAELDGECETLREQNAELRRDIQTIREINQTYYNKLRAQQTETEPTEGEGEEPQSLEDFARTLKI